MCLPENVHNFRLHNDFEKVNGKAELYEKGHDRHNFAINAKRGMY